MMFLKLCLILGLMALVAMALTRLFPARPGEPRERSFNELMAEVDLEDLKQDPAPAAREPGTKGE